MKVWRIGLAAYFLAGAGCAHAAPAGLLNKTVTIDWTVQSTVRDPDGKEHGSHNAINYTVYISSAGRLFERSSRFDGRRRGQGELDPGAGATKMGEARGLAFEGNTLVANRGYSGGGGSGAMRAVVSFDATYSSCTVKVTHGKEGNGPLKRRSMDGIVREILSITVTSTNCSVREGNVFASG